MRILITNDDGVAAKGIALLQKIALTLSDEVWVVAPADEQSGAGHSLTFTKPVRVRKLGDRHFAVSGTPTDSVMMALGYLMKDSPPDLILSGINHGANLAEDVTYSGTVSAAMEGALAGIRSIALSQAQIRRDDTTVAPFAAAESWAAKVLGGLIDMDQPAGTLINVNFPPIEADTVRGIRICRQGRRDYGRAEVVERRDPRGFPYFWFGLGPALETPGHQTDLEAIADGYVSVTPLHLDMTHESSLDALRRRFERETAG